MKQISPIYKRKVTKESFKDLVKRNGVLSQIRTIHVANKMRHVPRTYNLAGLKVYEQIVSDKCITQLVVKLESIFTSPDKIYLQ